MQKRLLISLTVISGLVWSSVILLFFFPGDQLKATSHISRAEVTVETKAPQDYGMLVEHLAEIRSPQVLPHNSKITVSGGITREWVNEMGKDKFSIDDLLASIEQEQKPPLDSKKE
ncbi:hypothetical protein [Pontibacillus marinus]|uniref:Uncharacterized protein n=1 Tax=Pontibacillus marinus BH030004 = DSM 16465 TaxID=1385511 RepID=A0A0A5FWE0_9BACI|nr:hypothetical protein [Pontibacillus marinus]KGX84244.1 hypothetical protein N783_18085 [Pontibacillus marinus BH030004 = DSM 16465]